jgi:hypothetical protein
MTTTKHSKIWFPAKTYGWGWGPPTCWQGWVVIATYVVLAVVGGVLVSPDTNVVFFIGYMVAITVGLIVVCWIKGEKPRWRWGKK